MGNPWVNLEDVEKIYEVFNGNRKGIGKFLEEVKKVACKSKKGAYIFKNEEALLEVFKRELPDCKRLQKIQYWGEIVQMMD